MSGCPWEEIEGFQSPAEFHRFERWMAEQIAAEMLRKCPSSLHREAYIGVSDGSGIRLRGKRGDWRNPIRPLLEASSQ
jgi:hypothetical protein